MRKNGTASLEIGIAIAVPYRWDRKVAKTSVSMDIFHAAKSLPD